MNKIKIISQSLISHIAAGEVIERPSSVVKELIENSIDAGSDKITIYIEDGGKEKITVIDNGHGIPKEDLSICFKQHATSKISNLEELFNLSTLGFRGEALSSIATVSRLNIESSIAEYDGIGYKTIVTEDKVLLEPTKIGRPKGTTIMVEKLFYNTPARRKHLKSTRVETTHIIDIIRKFALLYPNISFNLEQKGKTYFRSNGNNNLLQVISEAFGKKDLRSFREVSKVKDGIKVTGYISDVHGAKKTKKNQVLGINRRWVQNRNLHEFIEKTSRQYIPPGIFPQFVLNISIAENLVDNNIHPRKSEVRVQNEESVMEVLKEAIQEVLMEERIEDTPIEEEGLTFEELGDFQEAIDIEIIGQLKDTYILCEVNDKFLIIDQHAAHEAIIYHYLKEAVLEGRHQMEIEVLEKPIVVSLTAMQEINFYKNKPYLEEMGFSIEDFGDKSLIVRKIPKGVNSEEVEDLITEILTDGLNNNNNWLNNTLINTSCKSAIKAKQPLDEYTMTYIVKEIILNQITNCPHGRPLYITTGIQELHKKFKRIL